MKAARQYLQDILKAVQRVETYTAEWQRGVFDQPNDAGCGDAQL
jgi:uncharacterized protein with HEPN domain